jgi:hypothetical protein
MRNRTRAQASPTRQARIRLSYRTIQRGATILELSKPLAFEASDADHLAVVLGCNPDEVKDRLTSPPKSNCFIYGGAASAAAAWATSAAAL